VASFAKRRQDLKSKAAGCGQQATPAEIGARCASRRPFTIKDLSAATGVKGADIVKKLFLQGIMTTINSPIDAGKAQEIHDRLRHRTRGRRGQDRRGSRQF
jgi:translation initiation factor IF-2